MRILLDTHVLLWWLDDNPALSGRAREAISDGSNIVYVSAATIWEIVIKQALGKLVIPPDWVAAVHQEGFRRLSITWDHALQVARLPELHRDPFDRLLVAQAVVEGLVLVTNDDRLAGYPATILEAGGST